MPGKLSWQKIIIVCEEKQQDGPHLEATNHTASQGTASQQMAQLQAREFKLTPFAIAFKDIFFNGIIHICPSCLSLSH